MKKLLSLVTVLAVILSLCAMPVGAVEEYESDEQGVIYELNGDGTAYTVTGTYDTAADVVIPATFKGLPVTAIEYGAFWGCTTMSTVAFEGEIVTIYSNAFKNCTNLNNVTIPPSVTLMGVGVFDGCTKLQRVYCLLPAQPDNWESSWLKGCDAYVYWGMGFSANGLAYQVNDDATEYSITGFGFFDGNSEIVIPDEYYGLPVTRIEDDSFQGVAGLKAVTLGANITSIGDYAFSESGITEILIPTTVKEMGADVFAGCESLETIRCGYYAKPDGWSDYWNEGCDATVRWLGLMDEQTLIYSKYTNSQGDQYYYVTGVYDAPANIVIPAEYNGLPVVGIDDYAFEYEEGIKSLVIGSNIQFIGISAFGNCRGLSEITIPANVKNVDEYAFRGCTQLTDIYCRFTSKPNAWHADWNTECDAQVHWLDTYSQSLTFALLNDGSGYFVASCDDTLANVVIPDEYYGLPVKSIDYEAFFDCTSIQTLVIGANITSIDSYAFGNCIKLTQITIPENVVTLGGELFEGCKALTDIYCRFTSQPSGWSVGWDMGCDATVHWMENTDAQGLVYELNSEGTAYTVVGCEELTSYVEIPDTYGGLPVTAIGFGAFWDCTTIEYIEIGANVKTIDMYAFVNCIHLEQITIPATVTTISDEVFDNCTALTDIYCEFTVKPSGWSDIWNDGCDAEVHWLAKDIMLGDIDGDEIVNMRDAMVLYQFVSGNRGGMTDDQKEAADIDKSGVINMIDVMYLYGYVSGSRDSLT